MPCLALVSFTSLSCTCARNLWAPVPHQAPSQKCRHSEQRGRAPALRGLGSSEIPCGQADTYTPLHTTPTCAFARYTFPPRTAFPRGRRSLVPKSASAGDGVWRQNTAHPPTYSSTQTFPLLYASTGIHGHPNLHTCSPHTQTDVHTYIETQQGPGGGATSTVASRETHTCFICLQAKSHLLSGCAAPSQKSSLPLCLHTHTTYPELQRPAGLPCCKAFWRL